MNHFIRTFQSSTTHNIQITEERFIDGGGVSDFNTEGDAVYVPSTNTYKIRLNTNVVENASQEFISVTLMHEILHAYLGAYFGVVRNNDAQHPLMVENYCVDFMANILRTLYPGLSRGSSTEADHAIGLSWSGLDNTPTYRAIDIGERFKYQQVNDKHKSHLSGTICP